MFKTIVLGSCVYVQGLLIRTLEGGRVVISTGDRTFEGVPIR
jgi:hypothetical protein